MGDNSVTIYNVKGELRLKKVIGDRGLVFGYDPIKERAVIVERFSFKDRLNSSSDLWLPREQFVGACKQAKAIFKSRFSKNQPGKMPQPAPALAAS